VKEVNFAIPEQASFAQGRIWASRATVAFFAMQSSRAWLASIAHAQP